MITRLTLVVSVLLLLTAVSTRAQDSARPDATARIRFGPVALNPTLALTNLGRDDNVFNQTEDQHPQGDFTLTVTPAADAWMRIGRTWITGRIREDLVYFHKFANERSANGQYRLGWLVPLNRITFNVNGEYLNTRDRPGFEIDARARRVEKAGDGSVEVRALSKTYFGIRGEYRKIDFDQNAVFLGASLHNELNRAVTSGAVTVRHQLTPLTSLTLRVEREEDRFEFSPLRDSDSNRIVARVKFEPPALISGSAEVAYRDFSPLVQDVPAFRGLTSTVTLSYTAYAATKVSVRGLRDVQYSYDVNQPYYLQSGAELSIDQQIYGPFDVVGRAGLQRLDYRDRAGATVTQPGRTDHIRLYGGGAGYSTGEGMRIGFDIDRIERTSPVESRRYHGLRYGLNAIYRF